MEGDGGTGGDVLMSPPSAADTMAVTEGDGDESSSAMGAPRVELGYEPRYQRWV